MDILISWGGSMAKRIIESGLLKRPEEPKPQQISYAWAPKTSFHNFPACYPLILQVRDSAEHEWINIDIWSNKHTVLDGFIWIATGEYKRAERYEGSWKNRRVYSKNVEPLQGSIANADSAIPAIIRMRTVGTYNSANPNLASYIDVCIEYIMTDGTHPSLPEESVIGDILTWLYQGYYDVVNLGNESEYIQFELGE